MIVNVVINMHFFLPISRRHDGTAVCGPQPHKSVTTNTPQIDGEAPFEHLLEAPHRLG